jgi:hypothetical protein
MRSFGSVDNVTRADAPVLPVGLPVRLAIPSRYPH